MVFDQEATTKDFNARAQGRDAAKGIAPRRVLFNPWLCAFGTLRLSVEIPVLSVILPFIPFYCIFIAKGFCDANDFPSTCCGFLAEENVENFTVFFGKVDPRPYT
jgi:hypothetical protein